MNHVLVLGATSAIAQGVMRLYAARGAKLFLVARDPVRLDAVADDLRVRGAAAVDTLASDLNVRDDHPSVVAAAIDALNEMDLVFVAHGILPDQAECEAEATAALDSIDLNFMSIVSLLTPLANHLEARKAGAIAVISSVAGDRGRQSNYVYGAAKSGLDAFLGGLRNRLYKSGVHVLTVKPGFVSTPMTAHLEQTGPLWARPDEVAAGIVQAVDKRRNVIYLPWFWAGIMLIIRSIPEWLFKRLSL